MNTTPSLSANGFIRNASFVKQMDQLTSIHQKQVNIAIYERDINELEKDIQAFRASQVSIRVSGTTVELMERFKKKLAEYDLHLTQLTTDIARILETFRQVTQADSFRLHLLSVTDNMCSKFHTDINDLRLLCTYSGQGTCWLPEDAEDRTSYGLNKTDNEVVAKPNQVQQATAGDVVILKGALYFEANAVLHKSPSFEEGEENRILLRIDTNIFGSIL